MRMFTFAAMAVLGTCLALGQGARVSGGVMAGNILSKVPPDYPPIARAAHVEGTVMLHALIGKDGRVKHLTVVSGPPMLTGAAVDAVKQWVYKPYLLNGEPTEVDTTVSVNFSIGDTPSPPPVTIRGGVVAGRLLQKVPPVYPEAAKAAGVEGTVVLKGLIGKDGTLKDLHVISGPEMLQQAAIDATSQWIYSPYLLNGEPVEVDTTVSVNFNMGDKKEISPSVPPESVGLGPVRISGGVMAGQLLSKVQPRYPQEAKDAGIQGSVVLRAVIDKQGKVVDLSVISGPPELAAASIDAVKQWVYKPYLLNGEPVDVVTTITTNYTLAGR